MLLYVSDANRGGLLNMSIKQRAVRDAEAADREAIDRESSLITNGPHEQLSSDGQLRNRRNKSLSKVSRYDEHVTCSA